VRENEKAENKYNQNDDTRKTEKKKKKKIRKNPEILKRKKKKKKNSLSHLEDDKYNYIFFINTHTLLTKTRFFFP